MEKKEKIPDAQDLNLNPGACCFFLEKKILKYTSHTA
jgi:hypothetical protein